MKKLVSILSISLLTVALFTGCTSSNTATDDAATDVTTDVAEDDTTAEEETGGDATVVEEEPAVDAAATTSITDDPAVLATSLSADGDWISCITADVTVAEDLVVDGTFYKKDDNTQGEYRKLALYTQDDARNITGEFTLTVPTMTVKSPNFNIVHGTVAGNVVVEANGFVLEGTIDGDLTFANEEVKNSADISAGTVTGAVN